MVVHEIMEFCVSIYFLVLLTESTFSKIIDIFLSSYKTVMQNYMEPSEARP